MHHYINTKITREEIDTVYIDDDIIAKLGKLPAQIRWLMLTSSKVHTVEQLKQILEAIPEYVTQLYLPDLSVDMTSEDIVAVLGSLRPSVTSLDFFVYGNFKTKTSSVTGIMWTILQSISSLTLSKAAFDLNKVTEMVAIIQAIPESVTSLHLGSNNLADTGFGLAAILGAIHPKLTLLDLNNNNLDKMDNTCLIAAIQALHLLINSLDLSHNALGQKETNELIALIKAIKPSITTLNLVDNHLGAKSGVELISIIEALHRKITVLNLSNNWLSSKRAFELAAMMQALPPSITDLCIGGNSFSSDQLMAMFAVMPASLTSLDLHGIFDERNPHNKFKEVVQAIPASVRSLNLSNNELHLLSLSELKTTFATLPDTVNEIDLSDNKLDSSFKNMELLQLIAAFPTTVTKIKLGFILKFTSSEIKAMTAEEISMLKSILSKVAVRFTDGMDNVLCNDNPVAQLHHVTKLGREVPLLSSTAAFFVGKYQDSGSISKKHADEMLTEETKWLKDSFAMSPPAA